MLRVAGRQFHIMANTYSKIHLHIVFAVKGRESMLAPHCLPRIHRFMASTINNMGHHAIAVGGIENHVHILFSYNLTQNIADLVRELKVTTTKFINEQHLTPFLFSWQRGYSCFSYSASHIDDVKRYIENQFEHHKNITLKEEIIRIYERYGIEYDEIYIFEDP